MNKIVITGNPVDGYTYWGPFDQLNDSIANQFEGDWWVAELNYIDNATDIADRDVVERLQDAYMSLLDVGGATEREACRDGAAELVQTRAERDSERRLADDLALALAAVGFVHPLAPSIQAYVDTWEATRRDQKEQGDTGKLSRPDQNRVDLVNEQQQVEHETADQKETVRTHDATRAEPFDTIAQLRAAGDALDEALGWDTSFAYDAATTRTAIAQRRAAWKKVRHD